MPLLAPGKPVDWWFMFKLNAKHFPRCGGGEERICPFGGMKPGDKPNPKYGNNYSLQFVYASSDDHDLQKGTGCAGEGVHDPLGATFDEVYHGHFHYVIWNDQFEGDPKITGSGTWGHSKGLLAWNDAGDGMVLQVTTPSWPGAASEARPRKHDGNTLGCIKDNDVEVSQHFFAVALPHADVVKVLQALQNASVATKPSIAQAVDNGGPDDIKELVEELGVKSKSTSVLLQRLSNGMILISKPSKLHVPPWQLVSAELGGVDLRAATWWMKPAIPSTTSATKLKCWDASLPTPGGVEIATSGSWDGTSFSLEGGAHPDANHAKIGVSTSGSKRYAIFGDMNQQGTATGSGKCESSQNGRGGLFFAVEDKKLAKGVSDLIAGDSAPAH